MTGVLNVDTIADNAGTGPVSLTKQSAAKVRFVNFNDAGTRLHLMISLKYLVSQITVQVDYTLTFTNAIGQ